MTERSTRQELEQKYITDADRHIADAAVRIAALRGQIADLERDGSDASAARDALEALVRFNSWSITEP